MFDILLESFDFSYPRKQQEAQHLLIKIRAAAGISLDDISKKTSLSVDRLNNIELGEETFTLLEFCQILEACGLFEAD
ncbi:MAG: helix-turn-helix transcriptional regulator [Lactobacillus sp.]|nr:helix-turn-helix transcriptional regulator [Lactobacillus sp.]